MRHLLLALLLLCALSSIAVAEKASCCLLSSDDDDDRPEPRLSVATDPLGLVGGRYSLTGSYVSSRRAAISGTVEITDEMTNLPGSDGWRAAISLPIYLDRPLHGPYVEPGLAFANRFVGYQPSGIGMLGGGGDLGGLGGLGGSTQQMTWLPMHSRSIEPQIFVGWQWMFDSGLHIAGAVGVARHFTSDGSGTSSTVQSHYLRIGYAL